MAPQSSTEQAAQCPVDHKSRQAWLSSVDENKRQYGASGQSTARSPVVPSSSALAAGQASASETRATLDNGLSTERQVSSIPRGSSNSQSTDSPNAQSANPETSASGNWIYPSEAQFFAAMARKNYSPQAQDMSSIVPIHNAVNERTWHEILNWEKGKGGEKCGGPRLVSFRGDSQALTPRARMYSLLGYQTPFDRHDWVVERCGTRIEYVIDFYQGKSSGNAAGPSFFLDVRPKLNSLEGCRMRFMRLFGV